MCIKPVRRCDDATTISIYSLFKNIMLASSLVEKLVVCISEPNKLFSSSTNSACVFGIEEDGASIFFGMEKGVTWCML